MSPPPNEHSGGRRNTPLSDQAVATVYAGAYGIAAAQGIAPQVARGIAQETTEHFASVLAELRGKRRP